MVEGEAGHVLAINQNEHKYFVLSVGLELFELCELSPVSNGQPFHFAHFAMQFIVHFAGDRSNSGDLPQLAMPNERKKMSIVMLEESP